MADFKGTILTTAGRNLLAKALTGAKLEFTKVQLGDGVWDESVNPESLTSLVNPKLDLPINDFETIGDGTVRLRVLLTNTGLTEGFFTRELGIFAKDPDTGEEVLYSVAYAENPDYIPSDGVTKVENVFDVYTVIANAQNVTAVISDTVVLATKQDIEAHNSSADAHPDIREAIQNLQTQIANLDEGITPNIEEAINQHNQATDSHPDIREAIQNLQTQITNLDEGITPDIQNAIEQHNQDPNAHPNLLLRFIWKKETRNPTPNDIPPYENALWLNLKTGEIFVHLKNCAGKAKWKGQFGTIVAPSTVTKFDVFEDGSAVALYRFDGNSYDDGGIYNGTWYGTEQYDIGRFGRAAKTTGDGQSYIDISSITEKITHLRQPFTISAWVYVFDNGVTEGGVFLLNNSATNDSKDKGSSSLHILIEYNNDGRARHGLRIVYDCDNVQWKDIELQPNKWHHHVVTCDGNNLNWYVNGQLIDTVTLAGDITFDQATLTTRNAYGGCFIGHCDGYLLEGLNGLIDQVRIFNRTLTDEEIQVLYNEEVNC